MLLFGFFACVPKDHCFLVTYYYILALPKTNDLNLNWMSYIFFSYRGQLYEVNPKTTKTG